MRKRLTYANVVSSLALFLVLAGGGAVAASQLGKDSVGTKQLRKDAVTAAKIKDGAVTGAEIADGAVTGAKVKLDTLGAVPRAERAASAARADSAGRADVAGRADSAAAADTAVRADTARLVDGRFMFSSRPFFGQTVTVAAHGAVSLLVRCERTQSDRVELEYRSSVNGAVAGGDTDFTGGPPNGFLDAGESGTLIETATAIGETFVAEDVLDPDGEDDGGFVLGPDGKGLVVSSDALVIGLNYGRAGCLVAGVANAIND